MGRPGAQTSSRAGTLPAAARTTGLAIPEFRDRSRTWGERAKPCGLHPGPHGPCSLPLHSLLLLPLSASSRTRLRVGSHWPPWSPHWNLLPSLRPLVGP